MKAFFPFLFLFLFAGCAQMGVLTGGENDVVPPKLVKSFPENEAINFNQTKIELLFNEYVQLNNIQQQLIISPPVKSFPKVSLKGKRVVLTFDTLFRENTTYSLFFGDGVVDFTERNPWQENTLVFATGSRLDFLQFSGTVKNSFDAQVEPGMFVMLYPSQEEDSIVAKSLPSYFGKTDKNGVFQINHIHEGEYRAFGLKDINSNYLFDLPNEKIAYNTDPFFINDNLDNVAMASFVQDYQKQNLSTKKLLNEKELAVSFNKKTKNTKVEILNKELKVHHIEKYLDGDSLIFWLDSSVTEMDSIVLSAHDLDFSDTSTIFLKGAKKLKEFPLKLSKMAKSNMLAPGDSVFFIVNFPLQSIDTSLILMEQDSVNVPFYCKLNNFREIALLASIKPLKLCVLKIFPGCLRDVYGRSNSDTIVTSYVVSEQSAFGTLQLKLQVDDATTSFVMQLISSKKEIVKEEFFTSATCSFDYTNLPPDDYKIKLIFDVNNNGRWDTGNYYLKQQPEKILFYEKSLTVRANWEMEIEWVVTQE